MQVGRHGNEKQKTAQYVAAFRDPRDGLDPQGMRRKKYGRNGRGEGRRGRLGCALNFARRGVLSPVRSDDQPADDEVKHDRRPRMERQVR
jgi:hypothetical protein